MFGRYWYTEESIRKQHVEMSLEKGILIMHDIDAIP